MATLAAMGIPVPSLLNPVPTTQSSMQIPRAITHTISIGDHPHVMNLESTGSGFEFRKAIWQLEEVSGSLGVCRSSGYTKALTMFSEVAPFRGYGHAGSGLEIIALAVTAPRPRGKSKEGLLVPRILEMPYASKEQQRRYIRQETYMEMLAIHRFLLAAASLRLGAETNGRGDTDHKRRRPVNSLFDAGHILLVVMSGFFMNEEIASPVISGASMTPKTTPHITHQHELKEVETKYEPRYRCTELEPVMFFQSFAETVLHGRFSRTPIGKVCSNFRQKDIAR
ncbi:MAG: hypothetical protein M1840_005539 [Geoglossum simile]|nr:MAG: hypothetical protein M1840_005539 [Geoglossum simile]